MAKTTTKKKKNYYQVRVGSWKSGKFATLRAARAMRDICLLERSLDGSRDVKFSKIDILKNGKLMGEEL